MKRNLIINIAILFMAFSAFAQQSVFEYVEGEVTIKRLSGDLVEAVIGDSIRVGDSVITGLDGFAELSLENSSKITIDNDTVFIFSQKEKKEEKKSIFMVVLGKIGFKFDRLLNEPDIQTPATVAGVRGTEFTVVSALDGSTMYIVDEGSIAVEAEGTLVVLETQEGVGVPMGEEPGEKFEVLAGSVDFSGWLDRGNQRFIDDPAGVLSGVTDRLADFIVESDKYYNLYSDTKINLDDNYEEMIRIGEEKGDEAKSEYFMDNVRPLERLATDSALNYRYFGLSALSLRRYVVSEMYVSMKTRYIVSKEDPVWREFIGEYDNFLDVFETHVTKTLVESDI